MKPRIPSKKPAFFLVLGLFMLLATMQGALATSDLSGNTLLYWTHDDGDIAGATLSDTTPNGNDCTFSGVTTGVAGIINESFSYGESDYCNSTAAAKTVKAWSWWIYPAVTYDSTSTPVGTLFGPSTKPAAAPYKGIWLGNAAGYTGEVLTFYDGASGDRGYYWTQAVAGTFPASTWSHIVMTWNATASNYYLFVNGVNKGGATKHNTPTEMSSFTSIFAGQDNLGDDFNGRIDEFALFNDTLSAANVATLYNNGTGIQYPFSAPAPVGVHTYTLHVTDLYDDSDLAGVNVTFDTGCWNLTDAGGDATVTNVSICANVSGTLSGVTASLAGYYFNDTAYTIAENGTSNASAYEGYVNITSITRLIDDAVLGPALDTWTVNTSGGKTYNECGATYPCLIYLTNGSNPLTLQSTSYYDKSFSVNITAPETTTTTVTGVYDHQATITAQNVTGGAITASTNMTVTTGAYSDSCTTTTGSCVFNLLQGFNYTYTVQPSGYEHKNGTLSPDNASDTTITTHYQKNTISFYFYDEETGSLIDDRTVVLEMISDAMSDNYTTTNGSLLTDILSPDTYTLRYVAAGYATSFYSFTVEDNYHYTLNLTLLNISSRQNVTIYVKDTLGNLLEGAVLKVEKYDITNNDFDIVMILSTNFEGRAIANIVLNTEYYKFVVEYGGYTTTTNPTYIYGTELTFYHQLGTVGFEDYFTERSLTGSITHSYTTHISTFTYNDQDNVATSGCVYAYRVTASGETLVNSSCSSGASGTAYVGMANTTGANYIVKGYVTTGGESYHVASETVSYDSTAPESGVGMLFLAFLIMAVVFIGFWSLPVAVILASATPLLVGVTGLVTLPLTITVPLFGLGLIVAYLVGGKT